MKAKVVSRVVAVLAVIVLSATVAQAGGVGLGNLPYRSCYVINGQDLGTVVTLEDQFASQEVRIGGGRLLCTEVSINGEASAPGDHFKCYSISTGAHPSVVKHVEDAFGVAEDVAVSQARYLCVPATKTDPSP